MQYIHLRACFVHLILFFRMPVNLTLEPKYSLFFSSSPWLYLFACKNAHNTHIYLCKHTPNFHFQDSFVLFSQLVILNTPIHSFRQFIVARVTSSWKTSCDPTLSWGWCSKWFSVDAQMMFGSSQMTLERRPNYPRKMHKLNHWTMVCETQKTMQH